MPIETLSAVGGNKNKKQTATPGAKPAYDPYTVVPAFFKEVKAAQNKAFNIKN